jgi:hypothetical protein
MLPSLLRHIMGNPSTRLRFAETGFFVSNETKLPQPETCHIVHIRKVTIDNDESLKQIPAFSSVRGPTYELPTCPVCLERMDSAVTGLITVPCSHTFHCMCLSKWGDSRYVRSFLVYALSLTSLQMSSLPLLPNIAIITSHVFIFTGNFNSFFES